MLLILILLWLLAMVFAETFGRTNPCDAMPQAAKSDIAWSVEVRGRGPPLPRQTDS